MWDGSLLWSFKGAQGVGDIQTIFRLRFQWLDINRLFTELSENHRQLNIPRRFPWIQLRIIVQQIETFYYTYRWLGHFDGKCRSTTFLLSTWRQNFYFWANGVFFSVSMRRISASF